MLKNILENIFEIYLSSLMFMTDAIIFLITIALFVSSVLLPISLAIINNCIWWFLLYLISPLIFAGGFLMSDLIGIIDLKINSKTKHIDNLSLAIGDI